MPSVTIPQKQATDIHKLAVVISPENGETIEQLDPTFIETFYKQYGVVLLRGVDLNVGNFKHYANQLCTSSVFNGSGQRETVDEASNIQTVNLGKAAFALHPEMARVPWKPDACFFGCLNPPRVKGETLICDGVELVEKLPSDIRDTLSLKTFRYTTVAKPEELLYWFGTETPNMKMLQENRPEACPFHFFINPKGQINRSFKTPALHRTMFGQELAFGSYLLFARFTRKTSRFPTFGDFSIIPQALVDQIQTVAKNIQVAISWQKGDLLLIDNTRFMHGRNQVVNTDERKILTYFGFVRCAQLSNEEKNKPWRNKPWHVNVPLNFQGKQTNNHT